MHILMTADAVGGVWTYALDLIRALPQHRFSLATMGARPSPQQREALAALPNADYHPSDWKLEWIENPWNDVERAGEWLLQMEADLRPDLVHLNGFCHAVAPFAAPVIVVAHSCVASWWRAVKGKDAPAEWNFYREKVAAGLRAADAVVFPTQSLGEELRRIYGDFGVARVIWNGVSSRGAEEQRSEGVGVSMHPLSSAPPLLCSSDGILAAGRLWDEAKNIALLDEVAPHLSAPIRVAGAARFDGGQFKAENLELLGFLEPPAMQKAMNQAAIWAHPARYEPFGLAVLEAAQAGCALVLSDIPTLRELWEGAAVFAAPNAVCAWKTALQSLLDDEALRCRWAEKAQERARRYSLERFGAAYDALYQELQMESGRAGLTSSSNLRYSRLEEDASPARNQLK